MDRVALEAASPYLHKAHPSPATLNSGNARNSSESIRNASSRGSRGSSQSYTLSRPNAMLHMRNARTPVTNTTITPLQSPLRGAGVLPLHTSSPIFPAPLSSSFSSSPSSSSSALVQGFSPLKHP